MPWRSISAVTGSGSTPSGPDHPSELRGLTEEAERARFASGTTFGKQALSSVGDAHDVAEAIAWLCGDGGRWVTGTVIDVDGGYVLGAADVI